MYFGNSFPEYCLKEKYRIEGKLDKRLLEMTELRDKISFLDRAFKIDPIKDVLRFTMVIEGHNKVYLGMNLRIAIYVINSVFYSLNSFRLFIRYFYFKFLFKSHN